MYIHLPAIWEGEHGVYEATVSDIGAGGCFVLTSGEVSMKELIKINVLLPMAGWVSFWGEVVNYHQEIGFGLRFTHSDRQSEEALGRLSEVVKHRARRKSEERKG